jgi:hypothetical protein
MTSRGSSPRRGRPAADALVPDVPAQRDLRAEPPVRSLEELVAFLDALDAALGPDDRPRPPTLGTRFLL